MTTGVWIVGSFDWNFLVESVHATLEDAAVAAESYHEIGFVEFGNGPDQKLTPAQAKEKGYL